MRFRHETPPTRVLFGPGRLAELPDELDRLGLRQVLLLCSHGRRDLAGEVAAMLGDRCAGLHPHAVEHVPAEVAATAVGAARAAGVDGCVALGGGSAIGLAKAVALAIGLPIVAVPTTYAGSELTPIWGVTQAGVKRTGRDPAVLPVSVVYDPALTLTLPPETTVTSGMNAMAHAVEALYAADASPVVALLAQEGVRALAEALPAVVADPSDIDARSQALYGAWLCGTCLGSARMGLHHQLCHLLGGSFGLPHAATHTVLLPHVLAFNASAAPRAYAMLQAALGSDRPAAALRAIAARLGGPVTLSELGLCEADLDDVVGQAMSRPYPNPREVTPDGLRGLLDDALDGTEPGGGSG